MASNIPGYGRSPATRDTMSQITIPRSTSRPARTSKICFSLQRSFKNQEMPRVHMKLQGFLKMLSQMRPDTVPWSPPSRPKASLSPVESTTYQFAACKSASTRERNHNPPTRDAGHIILQATATFRYLSAAVRQPKSEHSVKDIQKKVLYNRRPKKTGAQTPIMAGTLNSGPPRNSQPYPKRPETRQQKACAPA